ncbi:YALIA101S02e09186g1_1 [Yarrowia lipolytica]|nr:YALIA101S02e09186g1_1 [Yarrowia lipolytica]
MENGEYLTDEFSDPDEHLDMCSIRRFSDILRPDNPHQPLNGTAKHNITVVDLQLIQQQQTLFYDIFSRASEHSDTLSVVTLYLAYNTVLKQSNLPQDAWVIRTLRRVCAQEGRSWEEKFRNLNDTYIKYVERQEQEEKRARDALYESQALGLRRRNLLINTFHKLKAECKYRRKLRALARKMDTLTLKKQSLQTIKIFNAKLRHRHTLSKMFRERELKRGFLSIMRNTTQTVLQDSEAAYNLYVLKTLEDTFGWWKAKTQTVVRNQHIALGFYNDMLLSRCLNGLKLGATTSKLINARDGETKRKVWEAWRWNAAKSNFEYHEATKHSASVVLNKHWTKLVLAKANIDRHNLSAQRFYKANAFIKFFHMWRKATKMVTQKDALVAKTNETLAKNVLDAWRASLLLKLEAKRFRKHSLLHLGLTAFTIGLKTQAVQRRRGDDLKYRILTMWRFKSRARLTSRVNNGVMAKTILVHWRQVTAERIDSRTMMFQKKTMELNQKIAHRFLNIWRDHLEDVALDMSRAHQHYRNGLLTLGFSKISTVFNKMHDMYSEAEDLRNRNVGKSFLKYWRTNMETKRSRRHEEEVREFRAHRDHQIAITAFSRWRLAKNKVEEDMAVAEDLFIEKDMLTMKEIFDHWRFLSEQSRGLVEDASAINDKRLLNAHFSSWLFKAERADLFSKAANDTRTKNLKKIQRQHVRKWRLRTLRMIQNQRTAEDFEKKRDSRLAEPYFKKWLNKCREKTGFGPTLSDEAVNYHEIREMHGFETPLRSSRRPPTSIRMSRLRQDPSTPRTLLAPLLRKQLDNVNQQTI